MKSPLTAKTDTWPFTERQERERRRSDVSPSLGFELSGVLTQYTRAGLHGVHGVQNPVALHERNRQPALGSAARWKDCILHAEVGVERH